MTVAANEIVEEYRNRFAVAPIGRWLTIEIIPSGRSVVFYSNHLGFCDRHTGLGCVTTYFEWKEFEIRCILIRRMREMEDSTEVLIEDGWAPMFEWEPFTYDFALKDFYDEDVITLYCEEFNCLGHFSDPLFFRGECQEPGPTSTFLK